MITAGGSAKRKMTGRNTTDLSGEEVADGVGGDAAAERPEGTKGGETHCGGFVVSGTRLRNTPAGGALCAVVGVVSGGGEQELEF